MRALGAGSQGADISLWELLPFPTCCLQLTGHWLLIWETNPDGRIAITISSLWNKLIVLHFSTFCLNHMCHSGHTLRESRAPWVLCSITASVLLGGLVRRTRWTALLKEELLWKSQREAVALGLFSHPALQWDCRHGRGCYTSTEKAFASCN